MSADDGIVVAIDRAGWARRIGEAWGSMLEAVLATGRALVEAKKSLGYGVFLAMIEADLPFGRHTAERLMKIARDPKIANCDHGRILPASWQTLYELTKLDEQSFADAIDAGVIHSDMERHEAALLRTAERRETRLAKAEEIARKSRPLDESLAARPWPVLYADPPWKHHTWSEAGKLKSPENHYPTLSLDELKALRVRELAGPRAAMFMWATVPHLADAMDLLATWGFEYRSHLVWYKTYENGQPRAGTGHWFRNTHELLLLGIRGDMPAPVPGTQSESVIVAPVGRHSEKPAWAYELIERYFPGVARVELFARGRRDGWDAWGNEI